MYEGVLVMNDVKEHIEKLFLSLKRDRDELKVKLHLAKMDAGDEWVELEEKLVKLEAKAKDLGEATAQASRDTGAAARLLAEEIGKGLKRIAGKL